MQQHVDHEAMYYEGYCPKCGTHLRARPKRSIPTKALEAVWRAFDRLMDAMQGLLR